MTLRSGALGVCPRALAIGLALFGCGAEPGDADDFGGEQASPLAGRLDGTYRVRSVQSGKCLDIKDRSRINGATVQQWDCSNQSNQTWRVTTVGDQYRIESLHSGKCLDVRDRSTRDGAGIQQWDCGSNQPNQTWRLVSSGGAFGIVSSANGKCLDVTGRSQLNGAVLQQWGCGSNQANQQWRLEAVSPLPAAAEAKAMLRLVNDFWINGHVDSGDNAWARAVYFVGDMAAAEVTGEQRYLDYAANWAKKHQFGLKGGPTTSFADDQVAAQVYLDLYRRNPEPARLSAIRQSLNGMIQKPGASDWWWVDALFMAMPAFTKLGVVENDKRYLEEMYALYAYNKRAEGHHHEVHRAAAHRGGR